MKFTMYYNSAIYLLYCIVISFGSRRTSQMIDINDVFQFFPDCENDGLKLRWAHAVNSWSYLNETLQAENVTRIHMLEGDVIIRQRNETNDSLDAKTLSYEEIPVMAHPPATDSNLTFEDWLTTINTFQDIDEKGEIIRVGGKADFKSINATLASLKIVQRYRSYLSVPLWLNADICHGPDGGGSATPVDADEFLRICTDYGPGLTLSLGWTTTPTVDQFRCGKGYGWLEILKMYRKVLPFIRETIATGNLPRITFAVRAALVLPSFARLLWLLDACTMAAGGEQQRDNFSITLWTSASADILTKDDYLAIMGLRLAAGKNRVFIDLPQTDIDCLLAINETFRNETPILFDIDQWEFIDFDTEGIMRNIYFGVLFLGSTNTKLGSKERFGTHDQIPILRGKFMISDFGSKQEDSILISILDADQGTVLWTIKFSTNNVHNIKNDNVLLVKVQEYYYFTIKVSRREIKADWYLLTENFHLEPVSAVDSSQCKIPLNCTQTASNFDSNRNFSIIKRFDSELKDIRFLITKTGHSDCIFEMLELLYE